MPPDRRVVLVTGCSRGGLGFELAREFARRGCKVYATARRPERMAGLDAAGCTLLQLDTTIEAEVEEVAKRVSDEVGALDVLVNNAGAAMRGPILDTPLSDARALFDVNYLGAVAMVRAFAPAMIDRRTGVIVNVGSASGFWSTPYLAHYSASKAAVGALSDSLRLELAPFGVKVVHAAPGFVRTEVFAKAAAAGNIRVDTAGPYQAVASDVEGDVFETVGRFPVEAGPFARRFASSILSRRPPALWIDGRWGWTTYFTGRFLPRLQVDLFSYFYFGVWKLTTWYPGAPPLVVGGPGPALLGLNKPTPAKEPWGGPPETGAPGAEHHHPPVLLSAALQEGTEGVPPSAALPEATPGLAASAAAAQGMAAPPLSALGGGEGEDLAAKVASRFKAATTAVKDHPITAPPSKPQERFEVQGRASKPGEEAPSGV